LDKQVGGFFKFEKFNSLENPPGFPYRFLGIQYKAELKLERDEKKGE
jgi:hypothetical protein